MFRASKQAQRSASRCWDEELDEIMLKEDTGGLGGGGLWPREGIPGVFCSPDEVLSSLSAFPRLPPSDRPPPPVPATASRDDRPPAASSILLERSRGERSSPDLPDRLRATAG